MGELYEALLKEKIQREERARLRARLMTLLSDVGIDEFKHINMQYSEDELFELLRKAIACLQERIDMCNKAYKKLQRKNDQLAQTSLSFMNDYANRCNT